MDHLRPSLYQGQQTILDLLLDRPEGGLVTAFPGLGYRLSEVRRPLPARSTYSTQRHIAGVRKSVYSEVPDSNDWWLSHSAVLDLLKNLARIRN